MNTKVEQVSTEDVQDEKPPSVDNPLGSGYNRLILSNPIVNLCCPTLGQRGLAFCFSIEFLHSLKRHHLLNWLVD